ncbi:MAG: hypothetical protein IKE95_06395 [Methanobrevibacter sp.]|nr:hypothetical protein [Methanobrevibacter sp.]
MIFQSSVPTRILKEKFDKDDLVFYIRYFLPILIFMMTMPVVFGFLCYNNSNIDKKTVICSGIFILFVNTFMFIVAIIIWIFTTIS